MVSSFGRQTEVAASTIREDEGEIPLISTRLAGNYVLHYLT